MTLDQGLLGLVRALPVGWRFAKVHPRRRELPEQVVVAAGRAAVVTSFASFDGSARFAVVSARDTLETLAVHLHGVRGE